LTDQVEKGNLRIEYCPTAEMNGDYMSKPLQGSLFEKFRSRIMGHGHVLPQDGGNRSVLEETKYHGASERPGNSLRTVSARTNASSGTE